jgi:hypothetical protein
MKSQQSMQGLLERRYLLTVFYRRRTLRKEGLPGGLRPVNLIRCYNQMDTWRQ